MSTIEVTVPFDNETVGAFKAGQRLLLSGIIYTARDAAHRRIQQQLLSNEFNAFPLHGSVIYYCGPTPTPPGKVIGSAGPTTSYRMDPFVPLLLENGVKGFIGKGKRSEEVKEYLKKFRGVYLIATGGAGALLSTRINSCRIVAYPELGPEAIYELTVQDFPVIVGIDVFGNDVYEIGPFARV
jgi:fumarate hydratase subunit beta